MHKVIRDTIKFIGIFAFIHLAAILASLGWHFGQEFWPQRVINHGWVTVMPPLQQKKVERGTVERLCRTVAENI